jgi:hypothetical protein
MPVIYLPPNAVKVDYDKARELVERVRIDEYYGVVIPGPKATNLEEAEAGGWRFELATSGGRANVGVLEMLEYYDRRMAMAVLAQFLILGSTVGSWALSRDQSDIFLMALEGWATMIAETINRHAIPKLMRMNGWDEEQSPHLEPSGLARANLVEMAAWIKTMFEVGMPVTDLEDQVRAMADLPPREEGEEPPEEEELGEVLTPTGEELEEGEEVEKQEQEDWYVKGHVPTADEVESGWEVEESDIQTARRELAEMIGEPV